MPHETGFGITLLDEPVPHTGGVDDELIHLGIFLRRAFDRLHAIQRFGEVGVHLAKGAAHLIRDRRQRFQVADQQRRNIEW